MLSTKLPWELANPKWASEINPILVNPINNMLIIPNQTLSIGTNVINHGLGKMQHGWAILDIDGASDIYRNAPLNSTTLSLSSSAQVVVSIGVF